ncbi:unnamed protein product [Cuscuta europaea]|uniref:Uncharacterized protein n=1 Tax=Cuscuta europaea TaxID=41803 RepID=A0A9P0YGT7_CUSEU|nr:unnamed protein product [Cuscuta europaea]
MVTMVLSSNSFSAHLAKILVFSGSPDRNSLACSVPFTRRPHHLKTSQRMNRTGALKDWKDYDQAVKDKDLTRALRFLKSTPVQPKEESWIDSSRYPSELDWARAARQERNWEVLDTCLNADDMRLVAGAYTFLKVLEGTRDVTPSLLKSLTGLDVTKLSPKKWGLSGSSSFILIALLAGISFMVNQGMDIRPNITAVLGLTMLDAIFLGGSCLAQVSSYWPPYRRRILVHEAGHLLVAYLMGCPIRGVILDPIVAMQMGIQGQAGTQFWDEKLENELAEGRLSRTGFDRYCMVLFAGIAAEALVYGEAEGGENDENLFRSTCILLDPPLSVAQMSNQARWSVMQSYNLLKWHKHAHRAAFQAIEGGQSLSVIIKRIEEAMSSGS